MGSWESLTTLFAGLLAVVILSSCITLAKSRSDQVEGSTIRTLSAVGLAATALFGIGLVYQLVVQLWTAFYLLN